MTRSLKQENKCCCGNNEAASNRFLEHQKMDRSYHFVTKYLEDRKLLSSNIVICLSD